MSNIIVGCISVCIALSGFAIVLSLNSINESLQKIWVAIAKETSGKLDSISNSIDRDQRKRFTDIERIDRQTDKCIIERQADEIGKLERQNADLWSRYNAEVRKNATKEETHD